MPTKPSTPDLSVWFTLVRTGAIPEPLREGSFGIRDVPCPGCGELKLCVRWRGELLAVTCGRPPLGCGFLLLEERATN